MSRDDSKRALKTIKTMLNYKPDKDTDELCVVVIEGLMKCTIAEYKQYLKDQQENAIEMWRLVDSDGHVLPGDNDTPEESIEWLNQLKSNGPNKVWEDYKPVLFKEVMDNE